MNKQGAKMPAPKKKKKKRAKKQLKIKSEEDEYGIEDDQPDEDKE